jgi:hypothetical protein
MRNWITHRINPVVIHCRLIDIGMNRRLARNFSAWLEKILMIHKKKDGYGCIKAGYLA